MQLSWSYLVPCDLGGVGLLSSYSLMVLVLARKDLGNLGIGRRHLHQEFSQVSNSNESLEGDAKGLLAT